MLEAYENTRPTTGETRQPIQVMLFGEEGYVLLVIRTGTGREKPLLGQAYSC